MIATNIASGQRQRIGLGALLGALLLAVLGEVALRQSPTGSLVGVGLLALAIGLFLAVACAPESFPRPGIGARGRTDWRPRSRRPLVLLVLSALLWVQAVRLSLTPSSPLVLYERGFQLWLISIVLFIAAGLTQFPPPRRLAFWPRLRTARLELMAVGGLTLIALLLRLVGLAEIPYPLAGDEAAVGLEGLRILRGQTGSVFQAGWSDQPTASFLPTALSLNVLGPDVVGVRLPSVVLGTAAVPLLYLLGRRMFGPRAGFMAAAFLATWHYHIHFSRLGFNNVSDSFFAVLVFWLVYRAVESDQALDYLWAGLAAGLTWYAYAGTRLVFLLALLYIAFVAVRDRAFLRRSWRCLLTFASAALLVAGPQLLFFKDHPSAFAARMNQTGILQSGWLAAEAARLDVNPLLIVADQFSRSFLVFLSLPAHLGFYNAPVPLLDLVSAILLLFGLAYSMARLLDRRYFLLVSWFWAVIVLGGTLTHTPPYVARLVQAGPAVCLFVAVALAVLVETARKRALLPQRYGQVAAGVVLVAVMAMSIHFYFREYAPREYFGDSDTELGHVMGYYLRGLGDDYLAYLAAAPRLVVNSAPSIRFLAPDARIGDVLTPLSRDTVPVLIPGQRTVFLAVPERRAELELVRERYPNGAWREFYERSRPVLLFVAYELPGETPLSW